jgi:hypothetical protein
MINKQITGRFVIAGVNEMFLAAASDLQTRYNTFSFAFQVRDAL